MSVLEKLRSGQSCHVRDDEDYVREAHGVFNGNFDATNFLTPPFQIDAAC